LKLGQSSIREAAEQGIAIVYQELTLVATRTVGENVYLGKEPVEHGMINWNKLYADTQAERIEVLSQGGGATRIGNDNLFMAYSHVAHDCIVGSNTVFANGATLAGHVVVEDYVNVGAFSPVHQFCRVGRYAYIGACTVITQDVPPFSRVVTERETKCYGVNTVGLERRGFDRARLEAIESAYRLLLRSKLNTTQALEQIRAQLNGSPDIRELVEFIESAERGLHK